MFKESRARIREWDSATWKNVASTIQAMVVSAGLAAAGIWTLIAFLVQGEPQRWELERTKLEAELNVRPILQLSINGLVDVDTGSSHRVIYGSIAVENVGARDCVVFPSSVLLQVHRFSHDLFGQAVYTWENDAYLPDYLLLESESHVSQIGLTLDEVVSSVASPADVDDVTTESRADKDLERFRRKDGTIADWIVYVPKNSTVALPFAVEVGFPGLYFLSSEFHVNPVVAADYPAVPSSMAPPLPSAGRFVKVE
jgi:hypothetical protein